MKSQTERDIDAATARIYEKYGTNLAAWFADYRRERDAAPQVEPSPAPSEGTRPSKCVKCRGEGKLFGVEGDDPDYFDCPLCQPYAMELMIPRSQPVLPPEPAATCKHCSRPVVNHDDACEVCQRNKSSMSAPTASVPAEPSKRRMQGNTHSYKLHGENYHSEEHDEIVTCEGYFDLPPCVPVEEAPKPAEGRTISAEELDLMEIMFMKPVTYRQGLAAVLKSLGYTVEGK